MKKDPVIEKLLDHDRRLEWIEANMVTKGEFRPLVTMVEEVLVTVRRIDAERKVHAHQIARLHDRDDEQQVELDQIEERVGMK